MALKFSLLLSQSADVVIEFVVDVFQFEDHSAHAIPVLFEHAMDCLVVFGEQLVLKGLDGFLQVFNHIVFFEEFVGQPLQTLPLLRDFLLLTTHVLR